MAYYPTRSNGGLPARPKEDMMTTNPVPPPSPLVPNQGRYGTPNDGPPRPRIRATTPNPSRVRRATAEDLAAEYAIGGLAAIRRLKDALTGRPLMALEHLPAGFAAWAAANDPQPAWWKRRARREWRNRWGLTP